MKDKSPTVSELAERVGGRVFGDGNIEIERVGKLDAAGPQEIAYVDDEKFFETGKSSSAACLIVSSEYLGSLKDVETVPDSGKALIEVAKPKLAFALIAALLHPAKRREPFVHPSAAIAETADIDLTVFIGPHVSIGEGTRVAAGTRIEAGVVIGDDVRIGNDCVLHPGVTLYDDVTIGDRVILHAGVVIGADGFGYVRGDAAGGNGDDDSGDEARGQGEYHKFPQRGTVLIEDDV